MDYTGSRGWLRVEGESVVGSSTRWEELLLLFCGVIHIAQWYPTTQFYFLVSGYWFTWIGALSSKWTIPLCFVSTWRNTSCLYAVHTGEHDLHFQIQSHSHSSCVLRDGTPPGRSKHTMVMMAAGLTPGRRIYQWSQSRVSVKWVVNNSRRHWTWSAHCWCWLW